MTIDGQTSHVVHTERFRFHAPWRFVAEPFLRNWIAQGVPKEMERLKAILESEAPTH
ncbi:MAG: hypothetical protein H6725_03925 [Sandaracinaceae bacterium]|nr:hypothetical protein [Sandaracinaceae bacterium]